MRLQPEAATVSAQETRPERTCPKHRADFSAGTPESAPADAIFDAARWSGLHYTRAAKDAARGARQEAE